MRASIAVVLASSLLAFLGTSSGVASTNHAKRAVPAHPHKQIAFHGSFTGTITPIMRSTGIQAVGWGTGTATLLGPSVMLGTGPVGEFTGQNCVPYRGVVSITHIGGTERLFLAFIALQACRATAPNQLQSSGNMRVLGGVGRFSSATGNLHFTSTATFAAPVGPTSLTMPSDYTLSVQGAVRL